MSIQFVYESLSSQILIFVELRKLLFFFTLLLTGTYRHLICTFQIVIIIIIMIIIMIMMVMMIIMMMMMMMMMMITELNLYFSKTRKNS